MQILRSSGRFAVQDGPEKSQGKARGEEIVKFEKRTDRLQRWMPVDPFCRVGRFQVAPGADERSTTPTPETQRSARQ